MALSWLTTGEGIEANWVMLPGRISAIGAGDRAPMGTLPAFRFRHSSVRWMLDPWDLFCWAQAPRSRSSWSSKHSGVEVSLSRWAKPENQALNQPPARQTRVPPAGLPDCCAVQFTISNLDPTGWRPVAH